MPISQAQAQQIKGQIIAHIEKTFPPDKKYSAIDQLNSMTIEELEAFLIQNKMIKDMPSSDGSSLNLPQSNMTQSPFRMIILGEIPSIKIDENNDALAVLEINPISKGHIIIIPKIQLFDTDNIPKQILSLAEDISKRLKSKLNYKEVAIYTNKVLGEVIINVIPITDLINQENIDSPRSKATNEELKELQEILKKENKTKKTSSAKPKIPKAINSSPEKKVEFNKYSIQLPRRIP